MQGTVVVGARARHHQRAARGTRRDIAGFVKKGRQLRAQEIDKLFRSTGHGIARLGRAARAAAMTRARWARERAYQTHT